VHGIGVRGSDLHRPVETAHVLHAPLLAYLPCRSQLPARSAPVHKSPRHRVAGP
jgi:hypothetical protein